MSYLSISPSPFSCFIRLLCCSRTVTSRPHSCLHSLCRTVPNPKARVKRTPQTETDQQDDRSKLISKPVPAILSHLDKDNLIQELHASRQNEHTAFVAKEKIHSQRNTERFELCVLSKKIPCVPLSSLFYTWELGFSMRYNFPKGTRRFESTGNESWAQPTVVGLVDDPSLHSNQKRKSRCSSWTNPGPGRLPPGSAIVQKRQSSVSANPFMIDLRMIQYTVHHN